MLKLIIKKPFEYGFTLLEMLVVLILVSLMTTLLLEGVSYVLYLRSSFLTQLEYTQKGVLQEHWFRSVVSAIVTDYRNGEHIFVGEKDQFHAMTISPLDERIGTPAPFTWKLKYNGGITTLNYLNRNEQLLEITYWEGNEKYHFQYMSKEGEWYTKWPPPFSLERIQIPRMISLSGKRQQTPFTWLVKLTDNDRIKIEPRED